METGEVLTVAFRWLLSRLPTLYDLRSSYLIVTSHLFELQTKFISINLFHFGRCGKICLC